MHEPEPGFEQHVDAVVHEDAHPGSWTITDLDQPVHEVTDVTDQDEHHGWADDHESAHPLDVPPHDAGEGFHPGGAA